MNKKLCTVLMSATISMGMMTAGQTGKISENGIRGIFSIPAAHAEDNRRFTVTYHGNGNTGGQVPLMRSYKINAGYTVVAPGSMVREGYKFKSWNTKPDGTGMDAFPNKYYPHVSGNLEFFAQWTKLGDSTGETPKPVDNPQDNPQDTPKGRVDYKRVSGDSKYTTAIETSKQSFASAETVVLASGSKFPDALAAGSLAKAVNGPILLNNDKGLNPEVLAEINRLGAKHVIVVSGTKLIPNIILRQLEAKGITTERLSGSDRYETSAKIADKISLLTQGSSTVILASGRTPYDALSISAYAARDGDTVLLTDKHSLNHKVKALLRKADEVIVVGGNSSVSPRIVNSFKTGSMKVTRIEGPDRYMTSLKIAQMFYGDAQILVLADGKSFADALTGVNLANKDNSPIILTPKANPNGALKSFVEGKSLVVVGGENTLSDSALQQLAK